MTQLSAVRCPRCGRPFCDSHCLIVLNWAQRFGVDVAVAVSQLPERTLEDCPEAMLVTASELSAIIEARVEGILDDAFENGRDEGFLLAKTQAAGAEGEAPDRV